MTLRLKLALMVLAGIVGAIALLVPLLHVFSALYLHGYNHVSLEAIHRQAAERLVILDMLSPATVGPVLDELARAHPGVRLELLRQDGSVVYSSSGRTSPYDVGEIMRRLVGQPYNLFTNRDATLLYEVLQGDTRYILMLSVPGAFLQPVQIFAYFNEYTSLPFLFVPLLLVVLLPTLMATGFAVRLTQRIRRLSQVMSDADLEAPMNVPDDRSRDEIGQLTRRFREVSDTLREQFARVRQVQEARRTLVANLSHDLRTPLSSILGYAETLQHGRYDDGSDINRYATIIVQRARYMDRLLDRLFEASLLDRPGNVLEMRPCNICLLVEQVMMEYVSILEEQRILLDLRIPSQPIWLEVNDWSFQQVLRNLVDNALAYGSEGGYLGVRVDETAQAVRMVVSDRGKGIPPEEQERIFEPFYRVDAGRRGGSIGVGLAFAREVVKLHRGRIWVESQPYETTKFTIAFPKVAVAEVQRNPAASEASGC